ncbi:protein MTO1 homolog, mitochondrial [Chelonus insularis]|uniref:protein MTO1 homolog, mitochondrial n=1 Tax=Chelonus insularis TaxID=460826 RepID=UPI00158D0819|nr:protein MTO1 homolog, mitochondrial [Chelonus insularis]XP_034950087.1 protein MTO1 homolog, mitochondrial [Chelonus insularis]XP_034950088.1 protein MTO1 homolog, mitochondrial [Chelonus insularis]XP_034950089.1 protein MTO1 homolog, mitochondrial [Chelonus insularis]XP_034950090.1 protein MTO1 homolog, mitochondrial [Chelonus insularis]XP_034950091.1 protein MTO1 homolog, mitochondrial [Chelonus insularis]XP_034950092.1 protein MTO1 homolog, mitochondrial [Chelonus insularis]
MYLQKLKATLFNVKTRQIYCRNIQTLTHDDKSKFDVIVIGGGHAGTEACAASARMGAKTLLVTHKKSTIGEMSCNPSFGGIGKGNLMREVDALDGLCCRICDLSGIYYKILNRRKGPAVWGLRAQIDRSLYKKHLQDELFKIPQLQICESSVEDLILQGDSPKCCGIILKDGTKIFGEAVVVTTGTFLKGQINIGLEKRPAGRVGDEPSIELANTFERLGFRMGRLKTGTPPRLLKSTIDFSKCTVNPPDADPTPFSFMNDQVWISPKDQLCCYLTHTNEQVSKIIKDNLHCNSHVTEEINGPRYCPSIESKILKFKSPIHQIWLEPEGLSSDIIYPGGLSCTLPADKQQELVNCITGLHQAKIVRPGYGVEYDFVDPTELTQELETKKLPGLFLAGQINGTTGYEEAAAQGIVAGANAAAKVLNKPKLIINRTDGYIGVLIDDLTTRGTSEPYRMFTSRAEFRLTLRPDNADLRLTPKGYETGCVSKIRFEKTEKMKLQIIETLEILESIKKPSMFWLEQFPMIPCKIGTHKSAFMILAHANGMISFEDIIKLFPCEFDHIDYSHTLARRIEIETLYYHSIQEELNHIEEVKKNEKMVIPENFDYQTISISTEVREKLMAAQPQTIAAATRLPGVTPAAILHLVFRLRNHRVSNLQHN